MIDAVTTKLEIDVLHQHEVEPAARLAAVHNLPALVVSHQLIQYASAQRFATKGRYRVIAPVDWPKGEAAGQLKFNGLTQEALGADGFEIILSANLSDGDAMTEANRLADFVRTHLSAVAEVRFVLNCFTRPEAGVMAACAGLAAARAPTLVRTDTATKSQASKANVRAQLGWLERIRAVIGHPLKLSGNIDSLAAIAACLKAPAAGIGQMRFAVNLDQAQAIVQELAENPNRFRELMAEDETGTEAAATTDENQSGG